MGGSPRTAQECFFCSPFAQCSSTVLSVLKNTTRMWGTLNISPTPNMGEMGHPPNANMWGGLFGVLMIGLSLLDSSKSLKFAGESEAGEPEAGESDAGEPEAGESEAGEPEAGEPEAGEPEAGEPETELDRWLGRYRQVYAEELKIAWEQYRCTPIYLPPTGVQWAYHEKMIDAILLKQIMFGTCEQRADVPLCVCETVDNYRVSCRPVPTWWLRYREL